MTELEQYRAEAEAAIEAERDEVQYLTLLLIVNHRVPRLCDMVERRDRALIFARGLLERLRLYKKAAHINKILKEDD